MIETYLSSTQHEFKFLIKDTLTLYISSQGSLRPFPTQIFIGDFQIFIPFPTQICIPFPTQIFIPLSRLSSPSLPIFFYFPGLPKFLPLPYPDFCPCSTQTFPLFPIPRLFSHPYPYFPTFPLKFFSHPFPIPRPPPLPYRRFSRIS